MRNGAIPVYHPGMALLFSLIPVHSLRIVCMVHNQLGEQMIKNDWILLHTLRQSDFQPVVSSFSHSHQADRSRSTAE